MKYLLVIVCFAVSSLTFSQHAMSVLGEPVKADFRGRHCRGTQGLCSLQKPKKASETNALLHNDQNNNLIVLIDRSTITEAFEIEIFGKKFRDLTSNSVSYIIVENDFVLSSSIKQTMFISASKSKIKSGIYAVEVTETHFIITFNLE